MRRAPLLALLTVIVFAACAPVSVQPVSETPFVTEAAPSPSATPTETPALIDVTLYLPDEGAGLIATPGQAEDSPWGLLSALVAADALPDVDYGRNITFSVGQEDLAYDGETLSGVFVHLDLSDAFAQAIKASDAAAQRLMLQSLVNTFLARYGANGLLLSIEGTDLQTINGRYNRPIGFDELAQTRQADPVQP